MIRFIKIPACLLLFTLTLLACKKKSTTDNTSNSTTTSPASSLSIDGKTVSGLTHSSFVNSGNYAVIAYGTSGIPEIQVTFSGTSAPISGNYSIVSGNTGFGTCNFALSDSAGNSTASAGVISVNASASPNNTLSFSGIHVSGSGGSHTVSGTIAY